MTERSIEIIGGGLAGLALGRALRQAGAGVTVYEAGSFPRHRVCGEFITGLDEATIRRLDLEPVLQGATCQRKIAWYVEGDLLRADALPYPALGLSRYALDARLAEGFVAAGGILRTGERVTDLSSRAGRVFAHGRRRGRSDWFGMKIHLRNLATAADLELHLGEHAYVGLSHVEGGAVNMCGLFGQNRKHPVAERESSQSRLSVLWHQLEVRGLGKLADRLRGASPDAGSFCAVAGICFDRRVPRIDRIALGDACAMIPPFTGNGMAMAFQSAAAALDPLLEYTRGDFTWQQACHATNRALRGRFRVRLASSAALHPFLYRRGHRRCLAALSRHHLLPFGALYRALH